MVKRVMRRLACFLRIMYALPQVSWNLNKIKNNFQCIIKFDKIKGPICKKQVDNLFFKSSDLRKCSIEI